VVDVPRGPDDDGAQAHRESSCARRAVIRGSG
jgi:hypothetical protein